MHELDEALLHFGIKGMKWGVRRTESQLSKSKGQNSNKESSKFKETWDSMSRERHWKNVLKNVDKMSTKDMYKIATRIQLENDLKRLSGTKGVGTQKDKYDYRLRERMSDEVLSRKVGRLRAKNNLHRAISEASKGQREFGKKTVSLVGPFAVSAISRVNPQVGLTIALAGTARSANNALRKGDGNKLKEIIEKETGYNL